MSNFFPVASRRGTSSIDADALRRLDTCVPTTTQSPLGDHLTMTFLEAAIEVLRREGKPLAVRRLAELAVQHNLLSVVGRDPEGTMQARLVEVLDKGPTHPELVRVSPGQFGLRAYPPRPYPPVREGAAVADGSDEAGEPEGDAELDAELEGEGGAASADKPQGARRRRRRGRGGPRPDGAVANGAQLPLGAQGHEASPEGAASSAADDESAAEAAVADVSASASEADLEAEEFEMDSDSGSATPLMVSTTGDEELTRSGEEREVRTEILGRRDERGRRRREERGGHKKDQAHASGSGQGPGKDPKSDRPQPQAGPRPQQPQSPRPVQTRMATQPAAPTSAGAIPPATPTAGRPLANDLYELLRVQEGRPQHARALAQEVERKKILDNRPHPEIVREVRMALHGELTTRSHKGLRPRLRSLGGGNYAAVDRKLDDEVLHAERALEAALDRAQVAAVTAVRRRLSKLSPFSFEQLGRLCAEAVGVERPQLVKRGEGVAYYGGERSLGAFRSRVLVGVRSGEAELGRRAVGELRAGLDARGFDEGFLFALGRLSQDARDELRAGRAVTVYDGDSIGAFLVDKKLGVRMQHAPVPYVDIDFFSELNET